MCGEKQRVASTTDHEFDVLGLFRHADHAEIAVLRVREGRLFGVDSYSLRQLSGPDDDVIAGFLRDYYEAQGRVPPLVVVPIEFELMGGMAEWMSSLRGTKVDLRWAQRGEKLQLVALANENAEHAFSEKKRALEDLDARLSDMQRTLRLKSMPRTIECVDISHSSGEQTSAVVVCLRDGRLDRSGYRSYRVKSVSSGDDYRALYEVVYRRTLRGMSDARGWELPDLLVVDGGRGQLAAAVRAAKDAGAEHLELASIAKPRVTSEGVEEGDRIFRPDQKNPIRVSSRSSLGLLMLARDETHRASNELRLKAATREKLHSALDDVPGIGPTTRNRLLKKFGAVHAVLSASEEELIAAGATSKQAEAIAQSTSFVAVDNAFADDD